jgi:hypothetical protein
MKSKYIIVEMEGMELPLIFSPFLTHEHVAMSVKDQIQSAGYCELDAAGKWVASGQSVSLKLNARPQDAEILNSQLGIKPPGCQIPARATL